MNLSVDVFPTSPLKQQNVHLLSDHDEALYVWQRLNIKNRLLLHFDAHIDFEWIADKDPIKILEQASLSEAFQIFKHSHGWRFSDSANNFLHLGNYLYQALRDGMIRQWYWIVPDSIWENSKSRNQIWRDLLNYYRYRTGPMTYPQKIKNAFSASFFNVPFLVTSFKYLPEIQESVLLNIDVDYLTTQRLARIPSASNLRRQLPWIWPEEFFTRLQQAGISSEVITLSNSVRGGFTPIQFKFFGETLCRLFSECSAGLEYSLLQKAYLYYAKQEDAEALAILNSFQSEGVLEATRLFRQAQIHYENGNDFPAKESMKAAVLADPEFGSSYNSHASFFKSLGNSENAYQEYCMIHALLPEQIDAQLGKADYWATHQETNNAEGWYQAILKDYPDHFGACMRLGQLYASKKDWKLARLYLSKALDLNPRDISTRLMLSKTFLKLNCHEDAKKCLRETLGLGAHLPASYFLLAQSYWGLGFFKKAAEFWIEGLRLQLKIKIMILQSRFL